MIIFLAGATTAMLGFMLWQATFRMRRDRVAAQRELSRGKHAFRPKERMRFLLNRAFGTVDDKAEWEEPLVSRLSEVPRPEERKD